MASIALSGTGTKRVVLKTVNGVQKVSCSCCGCDSVPDEISVVFSGMTTCPISPAYPAPLTSATLTYSLGSNEWIYSDGLNVVRANCLSAKYIYEFLPEYAGNIPSGIAPDDTGTPLFTIDLVGDSGDVTDLSAFLGLYCIKNGSVTNKNTLADCGFSSDERWAYGGTATLSW
mgnify:CR=1 FL=1|tara:strand:- start:60 stop:578 length:519 start_codon:yes stop_codon:yes gene_type:complete